MYSAYGRSQGLGAQVPQSARKKFYVVYMYTISQKTSTFLFFK